MVVGKCVGPPIGPCPNSRRTVQVKLCQGDLMLCNVCEEARFPSQRHQGNSTSASTGNSSNANVQAGCMVNELLCFVGNKVDSMPTDLIIKLVCDFYDEKEIESAKKMFFDLTDDDRPSQMRNIKRQGPNKNTNNVTDIISLFQSLEVDRVPVFVARNLSNLPPISQNHFDMSSILREIETLKVMIQDKKGSRSEQDISRASYSSENHEHRVGEIHSSVSPVTVTSDTLSSSSPNEDQSHNRVAEETEDSYSFSEVVRKYAARKDSIPLRGQSRRGRGHQRGGFHSRPSQVPQGRSSYHPQRPASRGTVLYGTDSRVETGGIRAADRRQRKPRPKGPGIFVSRLHPETQENELASHIRRKSGLRCDVVKLQTRYRTYSSFFVSIDRASMPKLFEPTYWPKDALVTEYV